jgi:hypothetical protein
MRQAMLTEKITPAVAQVSQGKPALHHLSRMLACVVNYV